MDCGSWWFEHVQETYKYAIALHQKNAGARAAAEKRLIEGASDWGTLTGLPHASSLMATHVHALIKLADAAFIKDSASIGPAVDELLSNGRAQTDLYRNAMKDFPSGTWTQLFTLHITATGSYILALAAGDMEEFRKQYAIVREDRNRLASFWVDYCLSQAEK